MVTEKGEDYGRIHLHGIVWCTKEKVEQWGYGYTYIGDYVNQTTGQVVNLTTTCGCYKELGKYLTEMSKKSWRMLRVTRKES